jgi:hypothetical protein
LAFTVYSIGGSGVNVGTGVEVGEAVAVIVCVGVIVGLTVGVDFTPSGVNLIATKVRPEESSTKPTSAARAVGMGRVR